MKQLFQIFLFWIIAKISGIKNWILIAGIVSLVYGCSKESVIDGEIVPTNDCMAITYIFKETKDTIIHWHKVCDSVLYRFMGYPKESVINSVCDLRIQVLIISPDKCN